MLDDGLDNITGLSKQLEILDSNGDDEVNITLATNY